MGLFGSIVNGVKDVGGYIVDAGEYVADKTVDAAEEVVDLFRGDEPDSANNTAPTEGGTGARGPSTQSSVRRADHTTREDPAWYQRFLDAETRYLERPVLEADPVRPQLAVRAEREEVVDVAEARAQRLAKARRAE